MQLAVYLGFKEIYLLGIDCDYSQKVNHIKAYSPQIDNNAAYKMMQAYKNANEWALENNVIIYNATRNAKMDVFPKVNLEDIISKNDRSNL